MTNIAVEIPHAIIGKIYFFYDHFPYSYVANYQRVNPIKSHEKTPRSYGFPIVFHIYPSISQYHPLFNHYSTTIFLWFSHGLVLLRPLRGLQILRGEGVQHAHDPLHGHILETQVLIGSVDHPGIGRPLSQGTPKP